MDEPDCRPGDVVSLGVAGELKNGFIRGSKVKLKLNLMWRFILRPIPL